MLIDEPLMPNKFRNTPIYFPNNNGVFCLNINNSRKIIPIETRLTPHSSFYTFNSFYGVRGDFYGNMTTPYQIYSGIKNITLFFGDREVSYDTINYVRKPYRVIRQTDNCLSVCSLG